jgi:hypothetical protein
MGKSLQAFKKLAKSLINGTFILSEFDELKKGILSLNNKKGKNFDLEWKSEFDTLLTHGECETKIKVERIKQLETYQKLKVVKIISELLLKIKELNNLEGDFDGFYQINDLVTHSLHYLFIIKYFF